MKRKFDDNTKNMVWSKLGGKCGYCGVELHRSPDPTIIQTQFSIDHVIPESRGGTDSLDNLMPCCRSCNSTKRNKSLEDFRYYFAWMAIAGFVFSKNQIIFLEDQGLNLPTPEKELRFYFEYLSETGGAK